MQFRTVLLCLILTAPAAEGAVVWEMGLESRAGAPTAFRYVTDGSRVRVDQFGPEGRLLSSRYVIGDTQFTTWPDQEYARKCDPACFASRAKSASLLSVLSGPVLSPNLAVVKTMQVAEVAGRRCDLWEVRFDKKLLWDYCTVEFSTVPGGAQLHKTVSADQKRWQPWIEDDLKSSRLPPVWHPFQPPIEITGLPVRVRNYERNRPRTWVLKTLQQTELASAEFQVPRHLEIRNAGDRSASTPRLAQQPHVRSGQVVQKGPSLPKSSEAQTAAGYSVPLESCHGGRCILDLSDGSAVVHVIAVRGDPRHAIMDPVAGAATVDADAPGKPIVLVLAAQGPMLWTVKASPSTRIRQIVAFSSAQQPKVVGPAGVPVEVRSNLTDKDAALAEGFRTSERERFLRAVQGKFGTTIASLQCADFASSFAISSVRTSEMNAEEYRRPCSSSLQ